METQILEDIGFTNAEIKVYLSLLELGLSSAGPIIEKSGLQSSVVHMTLNKLVNKGFVSFVKQGQRNNYQVTNPKHISNYIEEKKKQFEDILPELLAKQQRTKEKSEVITFKGIRGVKELLLELLEAGGKEHHSFGGSKAGLILGDTFWIGYHKKRSSKGIKARLLFNDTLKEWVKNKTYLKTEFKFSSSDFEPLTETIIRNDKIGIIIWAEIPIGILIHNKIAANSYNNYFQILWEQAKN